MTLFFLSLNILGKLWKKFKLKLFNNLCIRKTALRLNGASGKFWSSSWSLDATPRIPHGSVASQIADRATVSHLPGNHHYYRQWERSIAMLEPENCSFFKNQLYFSCTWDQKFYSPCKTLGRNSSHKVIWNKIF